MLRQGSRIQSGEEKEWVSMPQNLRGRGVEELQSRIPSLSFELAPTLRATLSTSHTERKRLREMEGRQPSSLCQLSGEIVRGETIPTTTKKRVFLYTCLVPWTEAWNTKAENHELEIIKRNAPCQIRRFKAGHKGVPKKIRHARNILKQRPINRTFW